MAVVVGLEGPGDGLRRMTTHIDEVDRVLGGGVVAGSVVLLAGEPGIGKSTLVMQMLDGLVRAGESALLVTGEESISQVALRAARLGVGGNRLRVAATASLQEVIAASETERPRLVVVESIQTLASDDLEHSPGSTAQVRECAAALVRHAKSTGTAVVLVGHVTKDGSVAGPKTLEHVVDVVLTLEGERFGAIRLLRAAKNRFGSCEETGVFTMGGRGLEAVADPSAMLLADRRAGVSGSVVFCGLEGTRPVLVEIQALMGGKSPQPSRVAIGLDPRRLALLLGVVERRARVDLGGRDVFVAAAGGLAVKEPAADLPVVVAMLSAARDCAVPAGMVVIGEVGLAGEVRRVPGVERRLTEAARLGFTAAVVPPGVEQGPPGMHLVTAADIGAAFRAASAPGREAQAGHATLDDRRPTG